MTSHFHIRRRSLRLPRRYGNPLWLPQREPRAWCGERVLDRDQNDRARPGTGGAWYPACLIAQDNHRGYRTWRIERGLTAHVPVLDGAQVVSLEEMLALTVFLIAGLVLVPLPWAIGAYGVAVAMFHLWLHSNDRCCGGCGVHASSRRQATRQDEGPRP
ncbi:hypothetical protein ACFV9C_42695 [Kribbella sp. NPDC059898]|uniref:hypothetical protein n=1 Tax=Kribbella sp. NPDC059898 TaxID=3346995 RepID=UPI00365B4FE8